MRTITQITYTITTIVQYIQTIFKFYGLGERQCIDTRQCLSRRDFHYFISSTAVTTTTITCVNRQTTTIIEIITVIIKYLITLRTQIEIRLCRIVRPCTYSNLIGDPVSLYYHINNHITAYIKQVSSQTIRSISVLISNVMTSCSIDVDIHYIPNLVLVSNCLVKVVPEVRLYPNDTLAIGN